MLLKTTLLLILGVATRLSISQRLDGNDSILPLTNVRKEPNENFVLVNPKQVQPLETTIRRFLSRVATPVKRPIVLRSKKNDLQSTIREMCDSVRKRLMQFANDCGLTTTVRRYEQDPNNVSLSEDWFSEVLLQGAYLLRDLGGMINEIEGGIDQYVGERNTTHGIKKPFEEDGLQFLGVVYDTADFGDRLSQCLMQMTSEGYRRPFNLNQAILEISKNPPGIALQTLKSNLDKALLNDSNRNRRPRRSWRVYLCHAIIKGEGLRLEDCMRELQGLERCLHGLQQRSRGKEKAGERSSWSKAIQRLSDCKVRVDEQGKVLVSCKANRGTARTIKQKMRYVFERILDKKIPRRSPLHRAASDLGESLSGSRLGRRFVDELYQCFGIYDDGLRKLKRLEASKAKDKAAVARRKEISRALWVYKRGVFMRTFGAIGKMHRSATGLETFLVKGITVALNETWQSHVKILSSMIEWMTKLMELHVVGNGGNGQTVLESSVEVEESNEDEDSNMEESSEDQWGRTLARSKTEIMKMADTSMKDLMATMNRVSRQKSSNNTSMLASLANNLLLVTMFMETMGFVSTLFCFGQANSEANSIISDDRWERTRRSLVSLDEREDIELSSEDRLLLEFYENKTTVVLKR
ncbi:uncharacterized protein LOC128895708 [Hylaeus anthracinus]|uniref:uncharacterized protein LOC128895708 n=1 Tax=Hylaeus anthracinus TaxID=313031 RepID=UPI0023B8CBED|nr:uncharacterized protein LOC128895708 [Hylaeus anthracinus]